MPYPPGVSAGTPSAPWNAPPAPECPDCLETIQDVEDHEGWCECKETPEELHRINEVLSQPSYELGGL